MEENKTLDYSDIAICKNCYANYDGCCVMHFNKRVEENGNCAMFAVRPGTQTSKKEKTIKFNITNIYDHVLAFNSETPFFYDKAGNFWLWNKFSFCWNKIDETDLMRLIDDNFDFDGSTLKSGTKFSYLEAFKRIGRSNQPEEPLDSWVQFKNKIYDIKTGKTFDATQKYFMCNPIPYNIGISSETPVMDKLFEEWVGDDYVKTLYEIIAYSCVTSYPIHRIFCFHGSGCNGKSQFQKMLTRFLGQENITTTELDVLTTNRFETAKLYKKLVCQLGETNFNEMNKTSIIKRLSGGDLISCEWKQKQPFDFQNYAKIIINTNSLPTTDDDSDGFKRRWFVIRFPNSFKEGKDIISTIPYQEYENLAKKVCEILPILLQKGAFTNEGTIEERRYNYMMVSNPLPIFLKERCVEAPGLLITSSEMYMSYYNYLKECKLRPISKKEFHKTMNAEGFFANRVTRIYNGESVKDFFFEDIAILPKIDENCQKKDTKDTQTLNFQLVSHVNINKYKSLVQSDFAVSQNDAINHNCSICGSTPCVLFDKKGKPICENCGLAGKYVNTQSSVEK